MPEHVTSDQCETRRLHCGEAMANAMRRQETQFNGFLVRIEDKIDPLIKQSAANDSRSKSNVKRLNWLYAILSSVIVAVFIAALIAALRGGG